QSPQAPRRPEAGPVEGYRTREAEASQPADAARSVNQSERSLRQRDELLVVTGDGAEAGELPVRLGLLDALLARRDEVPPDVAWSVHGRAAQQHEPRIAYRRQRDAVARTKHEQAAGREPIAGDIDLARNQIDRALLGFCIDRQHGAG